MLTQRCPTLQIITQQLRERIEQGHYPPGAWLPTERELAMEFEVQRSTVRAALANLASQELIVRLPGRRPWVNELRSPAAAAGPHWRRSTHSQGIAAIMPQHTRFASSLIIVGSINRVLRQEEAPYRLAIFDNYGDTPTINIEEERMALQSALADGVAGVILWSMDVHQTMPELQHLRDAGIPVVFVDRHAPNRDGDFVGVDNYDAASEAVNYLLELGHRRIGYIAGNEAGITTTTRDRRAGYLDTLKRRNLAHPELVHILADGEAAKVSPAEHFLGLEDPPTAVFANNDCIAYNFIGELESRGLRVPEDMSVIGFDDIDRFSPQPSRLTTIQQPFDQMGRVAADLLLRRLKGDAGARVPWQHVLLSTPLIVRDTCCPHSCKVTSPPHVASNFMSPTQK